MSESEIFLLFRELNIYRNEICSDCVDCFNRQLRSAPNEAENKDEFSGPVSIWQVGKHFDNQNDPFNTLFVGKNARGSIHDNFRNDINNFGFIDATECANCFIEYRDWPYWRYTRGIIEKIYGDCSNGWKNGWCRVAFTNLVKCNTSTKTDNTPDYIRENCLNKLRVVWKEIDILKPKNIVFFSGIDYDYYIKPYLQQFRCHEVEDTTKICGRKQIAWLSMECTDNAGRRFKILRTSHPERKKKNEFVNLVANWITGAQSNTET